MLEVKKKTTTITRVDITGDSTIDGDRVAWMTACIGEDEVPVINMKIVDREKYQKNFDAVLADEKEFDAYVCESDEKAMTQSEEITGVFNGEDEPKDEDEEPDGDDEPDDDDKTGAGSEETIIP